MVISTENIYPPTQPTSDSDDTHSNNEHKINENTNTNVTIEQRSIMQAVKEKVKNIWSSFKKSAKTFIKMIRKFYTDRKQTARVEESLESAQGVV